MDALNEANKELDLLYSITRHDLLNQVSIIAAYMGLIEEDTAEEDEKTRKYAKRVIEATSTIKEQIIFMHDYESMGVKAPERQCVEEIVRVAGDQMSPEDLEIDVLTGRLEVFADPLFEKIIFNLVENTVRHGKGATKVRLLFHEEPKFAIWPLEVLHAPKIGSASGNN